VFTTRQAAAAGALQSAQMTLTVAGVEIVRRSGQIDAALGSALIAVALASVLLAPVLFARLMPSGPDVPVSESRPMG
jgi:Kef-type K+ transport system membrane component KefB